MKSDLMWKDTKLVVVGYLHRFDSVNEVVCGLQFVSGLLSYGLENAS